MKKFLWLCLILFALCVPPRVVLAHTPAQTDSCTTASPSSDPTIGVTPTVCTSITFDSQANAEFLAVSWLSVAPEAGSVQVLGGSSISDVRDPNFAGTTHYAALDISRPSSAYRFDVLSGSSTYTNADAHWSIGGSFLLAPKPPLGIRGLVKKPDGKTSVDQAIIYATVQHSADSAQSALLSQVITADNAGFFVIYLGYARTSDFSARFPFNRATDQVTLTAVGPDGTASTTLPITAVLPPQPPLTLILNSSGGIAVTATPSPIPPTSTPTPVTPTSTPTLPPATATAFAATQTALFFTVTSTPTEVPPTATRARPVATQPRPTAPPTDTVAPITIEPAAATELAQNNAEGTVEPGPETTRLAPQLATPAASNSRFGRLALGGSLFTFIAFLAFVGAVILGVAAFVFWKR